MVDGGYGVGTSVSAAATIDFSMDIVEVEGEAVAKRGKHPGAKHLLRCRDCGAERVIPIDKPYGDCASCGGVVEQLLADVMTGGERTDDPRLRRRRLEATFCARFTAWAWNHPHEHRKRMSTEQTRNPQPVSAPKRFPRHDTIGSCLLTHIGPDGDGLLACVALSRYLRGIGKQATVVTEDRVPVFVAPFDPEGLVRSRKDILAQEGWAERFDACLILDTGKASRLGRLEEPVKSERPAPGRRGPPYP